MRRQGMHSRIERLAIHCRKGWWGKSNRAPVVTKTAIGQHIAILESCQLVKTEKKGRVRMCRVDPTGLDDLQQWIDHHRGHWQSSLARLDDFLG